MVDSSSASPAALLERPADLPSVTVVIPVKDGAADLDGCLAALDAQDYPVDRLRVVVADNGSSEDIAAVVNAHPGVDLVVEPQSGSYRARNAALAVTTSDVVAFTDGDCRPLPDWVSSAVAALAEEPRAAMVGGAVQLTYRHGAPVTAGELFEAVHGFPQHDYLTHHQFAVTANMVTWRETLDRVGLFDGSLMSRGDADWGRRVASAGLLQRFAPLAVVRHPARETLAESLRKWRRVSAGRVAADLKEHRSRKHFLGSIRWQLTWWARTLAAPRQIPHLTTWPQRLRYLGAFSACRVVYVLVYARALLPVALRTRRGSR